MTRYFMSLPGRQSIIFLPGVRHIYIHYYDTTSPTIKALSLIKEGKAVINEKLCLFCAHVALSIFFGRNYPNSGPYF